MRKASLSLQKNKVKIILLALLIGNLALFQLTSSIFNHRKKAEVEQGPDKEKVSYFHGGLFILHVGHAVVDYFHKFGDRREK